jgi:hypothetical protein
MNKHKNINITNYKNIKVISYKNINITKYIYITALALAISLGFYEISLAAFDVDAGVKAATDPLIKGLTDHWGKGVMLTGVGSALIGEGDSRQRAIRAGIGCAAAGATVLGLLALLK